MISLSIIKAYDHLAAQTKADLNTIKAAYIERFTRFIDWPARYSSSGSDSTFVLAVFGDTPFIETLEEIYQDQMIKNMKVEIRQINKISDIKGCHILYVSESTRTNLGEIIKFAKDNAILTVSHSSGFAAEGIMINLYVEANKLRFEINEQAVRESKLKVSHHLLKQARIVNPTGSTK